ncbi:hypothetical protein F9L06_10075 [Brucella anthropi]|uniref:Uncharacterized protein n=1 Tax=Brucella anthropi TaxID=529 RepID=A0A6I0DNP1_BRUAN|nr:hypothetical protein [Brucella anthropi]KAB2798942.1 hypothetical protein F9L06_10075 [Brucella anthropi]
MSRKLQRGEPLKTAVDAIVIILNKGMIFHNHKCQSWAWMAGWHIRTLDNEARAGRLFKAIPFEGTNT